MTQLSRKEIAKLIIEQKEWSDQAWTDATGISRQTFWRIRNNKIKGVESKTLELMASANGYKIAWKDHTKKQGQLEMPDKTTKKGDTFMDIRDQTIKSQEMNIALLTEKITILENDLICEPLNEFNWTESNIEKFAVELNADSTFQEIASELNIKSEQWNYLFDNINQPLGISRKGIIRDVNQMYIEQFGYDRNEMIGKPITEFVHPEEHERLKKAIASERSNYIWRVKKKSGHYCRVRVQRQNFGDPDAGFTVSLMECIDEDCADID